MSWPIIKKWLKYAAIILVGILAVVGFFMIRMWLKKRKQADDGTAHVLKLEDVINGIRDNLTAANQQAQVEIAVSRSEETARKKELANVVKIKSKTERRRRMAELYEKVAQ